MIGKDLIVLLVALSSLSCKASRPVVSALPTGFTWWSGENSDGRRFVFALPSEYASVPPLTNEGYEFFDSRGDRIVLAITSEPTEGVRAAHSNVLAATDPAHLKRGRDGSTTVWKVDDFPDKGVRRPLGLAFWFKDPFDVSIQLKEGRAIMGPRVGADLELELREIAGSASSEDFAQTEAGVVTLFGKGVRFLSKLPGPPTPR